MKKVFVLVFAMCVFVALLFSCKKGCVDKNNKLVGQCLDTTITVCGCNGKTYKNPCEALKEGISKENQKAGTCN